LPDQNFNIGENLSISLKKNSPVLIHGSDVKKRDLACRLIAEGYSSKGIPCLVFTNGNRFSGIAKPNTAQLKNNKKLTRGFPTSNINLDTLIEKDFFFSVETLGSDVIGATILCNQEEQQQLNTIFSIAREQQRELTSLQNLQSTLAWALNNIDALPSWHGTLEENTLEKIQEKLLLALSSLDHESFGSEYFPLQQFYKKDYSESGFIHLFDTQISSKGIQFALLSLLGILKKLAECPEENEKLAIIIAEPRLSRNFPSQMYYSILKLLSLRGARVHFCFTYQEDADYQLVDISKQIINSNTEKFLTARSQSEPFTSKVRKRKSIQINRESLKASAKSLIDKVEVRKEEKSSTTFFNTFSNILKKTLNFR